MERWQSLEECCSRVPAPLLPWLTEPGLLTARVRAGCAAGMRLNLLRVAQAALAPALARHLGVADRGPLEYLELESAHELARAATHDAAVEAVLWARRKLYRLTGGPILVQEVFLPALCAR